MMIKDAKYNLEVKIYLIISNELPNNKPIEYQNKIKVKSKVITVWLKSETYADVYVNEDFKN